VSLTVFLWKPLQAKHRS